MEEEKPDLYLIYKIWEILYLIYKISQILYIRYKIWEILNSHSP